MFCILTTVNLLLSSLAYLCVRVCGETERKRERLTMKDWLSHRGLEVPWSSVIWIHKKVSGIIQSNSEVLRTRTADSVSPSPRAGENEMRLSVQAGRQEKRGKLFLPLLFVLFRPSTDWMMGTHREESHLLYWAHWFRCSSHPEAPSQTHPK